MSRASSGIVLVAALFLAPRPSAQKGPALGDILRTAATYIADFSQRLQAVIAEESYVQLEVSGGATRITRRVYMSEVAFVGVGTGRIAFYRDVISLDGKTVRDDESRFLKLFQPPTNVSLAAGAAPDTGQWKALRQSADANLR